MAAMRSKYQGVYDIICFNRHWYVLALLVMLISLFFALGLAGLWGGLFLAVFGATFFFSLSSLLISHWVHDRSELYNLPWLKSRFSEPGTRILNMTAGFDLASGRLREMFPGSKVYTCDFMKEDAPAEQSIRRARQRQIRDKPILNVTDQLPFENNYFDWSVAMMSLHEARDQAYRTNLLKELKRITRGPVFLTEHLRDGYNALAYSVGVRHFYSRKNWINVIRGAGLCFMGIQKTTPWITTFELHADENTP